ncbi:unnamed protein product, partial [Schistosoma curassoni]|uniref:Reverse transcriptase domain-containing protein n=1 Tax=Schistosoma curassoni TaxID=6186 RepID=A0A183JQQ0_9TREM
MPFTNIHRHLGRWAEFFEGQFNWPVAQATSIRLQLLKRYKSPGPDDLPPALCKDGGDFLTEELTTLFTKVWELQSVPTSFSDSIVVPIFKKGSRRFRNNYR